MAAKQVLLTDEGLHNLEQELEFLKQNAVRKSPRKLR